MKNSADLGGCYPPRPSASVDNTLLDLQNSSYRTQPHSIIIIAKYRGLLSTLLLGIDQSFGCGAFYRDQSYHSNATTSLLFFLTVNIFYQICAEIKILRFWTRK